MREDRAHVLRSCRRPPGRTGSGWWALLLLILSAPAPAQQESEEVQVVVAALPHIRQSLPAGPAALDPEAFCKARLVGWSCPAPLQNAVDALGFRLNSRTFVHVCLGGTGRCRLVGAESLVVLERPRVERNRATLEATLWTGDSGQAGSLTQRRIRLSLAQRSRRWEVVDQTSLPD